jgi:hypothetical protein
MENPSAMFRLMSQSLDSPKTREQEASMVNYESVMQAESETQDILAVDHGSPSQDSEAGEKVQESELEAAEAEAFKDLRKFRLKLALWNGLALDDAQALWSSPESQEVWSHYGYDVRSLQEAWYAYVIGWIQVHLASGTRSKVIMKEYRRFVDRTQRLFARCQQEKRKDDLAATLGNMSPLFEPGASMASSCIQRILEVERESESALFCLLRERPDLMAQ